MKFLNLLVIGMISAATANAAEKCRYSEVKKALHKLFASEVTASFIHFYGIDGWKKAVGSSKAGVVIKPGQQYDLSVGMVIEERYGIFVGENLSGEMVAECECNSSFDLNEKNFLEPPTFQVQCELLTAAYVVDYSLVSLKNNYGRRVLEIRLPVNGDLSYSGAGKNATAAEIHLK